MAFWTFTQLTTTAWRGVVGALALHGGGAPANRRSRPGKSPGECPSWALRTALPSKVAHAHDSPPADARPCLNIDLPVSQARAVDRVARHATWQDPDIEVIARHRCIGEPSRMLDYTGLRLSAGPPARPQVSHRIDTFGGDTLMIFDAGLDADAALGARAAHLGTAAVWRRRRVAYAVTCGQDRGWGSRSEAAFRRWAGEEAVGQGVVVISDGIPAGRAPVLLDPVALGAAQPGGHTRPAAEVRLWGMESPVIDAALALGAYLHTPPGAQAEALLHTALHHVASDTRFMRRLWQGVFETSATRAGGLARDFSRTAGDARAAGILSFAHSLAGHLCFVDYEAAAALRCLFAPSCSDDNLGARLATLRSHPRTRAWARHVAQLIRLHPSAPFLIVADARQVFDLRAMLARAELSSWDGLHGGAPTEVALSPAGTVGQCGRLLCLGQARMSGKCLAV